MDFYKSNAAQLLLGLYKCAVVTVPPSACVLMLWLTWDAFGLGVGLFPPVNDSMQVRLRAQRRDATQTRGNNRYGHGGKEKYCPIEVNWQADKARSRK